MADTAKNASDKPAASEHAKDSTGKHDSDLSAGDFEKRSREILAMSPNNKDGSKVKTELRKLLAPGRQVAENQGCGKGSCSLGKGFIGSGSERRTEVRHRATGQRHRRGQEARILLRQLTPRSRHRRVSHAVSCLGSSLRRPFVPSQNNTEKTQKRHSDKAAGHYNRRLQNVVRGQQKASISPVISCARGET